MNILIMNIEQGEKIGEGLMGQVYIVKLNGNNCIMKVERADPNTDVGNNAYARQVKFNEYVATSKYKKHYLNLLSHGWYNNCKITIPVPKFVTGKKKTYLEKRNKFNQCYYLVYSPVLKYTLNEVLTNKTYSAYSKIIQTMVDQLLPVIIDMHKNGYNHNDLHPGNIMYNKHWYIIDYGSVKHKSQKTSEEDKREDKKYNGGDLILLIDMCIYSPIKVLGFEKGEFKTSSYKQVIDYIKKSSSYPLIKQKIKHVKGYSNEFLLYYCELYYFNIFRKALGAPDNMKIENSKLCISKLILRKIERLITNI
jgi:serine/threonine protein kinase